MHKQTEGAVMTFDDWHRYIEADDKLFEDEERGGCKLCNTYAQKVR